LFSLALTFLTGILVEIMGVNTGLLFGDYQYGAVLSPRIKQVPWVIGINWFLVIYCCGISIHTLLTKAMQQMALRSEQTANQAPGYFCNCRWCHHGCIF
jgi:putative membrane protein